MGEKTHGLFYYKFRVTNPDNSFWATGLIQPADIVALHLQYPGFIEEMRI
jgi:hypothetical protein